MAKTVEDYLALPYTISLRKDPRDGIYVARVAEISGCSAHGDTEQEALANLHENLAAWIEDALEDGDAIPVPAEPTELPSGKWVQRVPRSIHKRLIDLAKVEETSLNQLVSTILAKAIGERDAKRAPGVLPSVDAIAAACLAAAPVSVHYLTPSIHLADTSAKRKRVPIPEGDRLMESYVEVLFSNTPNRQEIVAGGSAKQKEKHFAYA